MTKENNDLSLFIWNEMLTSDFSCRYWGRVVLKYQRIDRTLNVIILILSSATLYTYLNDIPEYIFISSLLIALLSIYIIISNYSAKINDMSRLCAKWETMMNRWKKLYHNIDKLNRYAVQENIDAILSVYSDIKYDESKLPHTNKHIKKQCYEETCKSWGV